MPSHAAMLSQASAQELSECLVKRLATTSVVVERRAKRGIQVVLVLKQPQWEMAHRGGENRLHDHESPESFLQQLCDRLTRLMSTGSTTAAPT